MTSLRDKGARQVIAVGFRPLVEVAAKPGATKLARDEPSRLKMATTMPPSAIPGEIDGNGGGK